MLGLDVSGNLPNKACDGGHRYIPHLSLTDKRPWSITSDFRPRDCAEQVAQVLKFFGQILLSSVNMRETLTCSIGGASWPTQCVLVVRRRTHAFLQMLSTATSQKTMLPFVFDDEDDWHIWPGDTDFLCASDGTYSV